MGKVIDRVYGELRRRLMLGHYPPETRIRESAVAAELDVSRTPVRSALQRLVAEGLLRPLGRRGAVTVGWSARDIAEVFQLRAALEGLAAYHAASRRTREALEEMSRLTDEMERLSISKPPQHLALLQIVNSQFHRLVLVESGCPRVRDLAINLMDIPLVTGGFYIYSDAEIARSVQHHRDVIDALEACDGNWARTAMENHLNSSHRIFSKQQEDREDQENPRRFHGG